ncbi:MAG: transcription elongation factor [Caulobacteraceae bacterium]|nr:transcription elongation factor [Caulobacteraceae bacterium]
MSVAFTREEDSEATAANLPDRPISPHANLVTATGLDQLDQALAAARAAYASAQAEGGISQDRTAMARATRDLRYYGARRSSAQLTEPVSEGRVVFGSRVSLLREDGGEPTYRIVGEDEADPNAGTVSYVSPLAQAVMGKEVGDEVRVAGKMVEILAIS